MTDQSLPWEKEFDEKYRDFQTLYEVQPNGISMLVPIENIKDLIRKTIHQQNQEYGKRLVEKIRKHFILSVFDNSGMDKTMNIHRFRQDQLDYLDQLSKDNTQITGDTEKVEGT